MFESNRERYSYRDKLEGLRTKIRKSEMERQELECKFDQLMRQRNECDRSSVKTLRSRYKKFMDDDRRRSERNENLLHTLERIDFQAAALAAKTERLKLLKSQYELFLMRSWGPNYPTTPALYQTKTQIHPIGMLYSYSPATTTILNHTPLPTTSYHPIENDVNSKTNFVKYLSRVNSSQLHNHLAPVESETFPPQAIAQAQLTSVSPSVESIKSTIPVTSPAESTVYTKESIYSKSNYLPLPLPVDGDKIKSSRWERHQDLPMPFTRREFDKPLFAADKNDDDWGNVRDKAPNIIISPSLNSKGDIDNSVSYIYPVTHSPSVRTTVSTPESIDLIKRKPHSITMVAESNDRANDIKNRNEMAKSHQLHQQFVRAADTRLNLDVGGDGGKMPAALVNNSARNTGEINKCAVTIANTSPNESCAINRDGVIENIHQKWERVVEVPPTPPTLERWNKLDSSYEEREHIVQAAKSKNVKRVEFVNNDIEFDGKNKFFDSDEVSKIIPVPINLTPKPIIEKGVIFQERQDIPETEYATEKIESRNPTVQLFRESFEQKKPQPDLYSNEGGFVQQIDGLDDFENITGDFNKQEVNVMQNNDENYNIPRSEEQVYYGNENVYSADLNQVVKYDQQEVVDDAAVMQSSLNVRDDSMHRFVDDNWQVEQVNNDAYLSKNYENTNAPLADIRQENSKHIVNTPDYSEHITHLNNNIEEQHDDKNVNDVVHENQTDANRNQVRSDQSDVDGGKQYSQQEYQVDVSNQYLVDNRPEAMGGTAIEDQIAIRDYTPTTNIYQNPDGVENVFEQQQEELQVNQQHEGYVANYEDGQDIYNQHQEQQPQYGENQNQGYDDGQQVEYDPNQVQYQEYANYDEQQYYANPEYAEGQVYSDPTYQDSNYQDQNYEVQPESQQNVPYVDGEPMGYNYDEPNQEIFEEQNFEQQPQYSTDAYYTEEPGMNYYSNQEDGQLQSSIVDAEIKEIADDSNSVAMDANSTTTYSESTYEGPQQLPLIVSAEISAGEIEGISPVNPAKPLLVVASDKGGIIAPNFLESESEEVSSVEQIAKTNNDESDFDFSSK